MPKEFNTTHGMLGPDDPGYVSIEEATRRELERRAEYEARPEVRAKRKQDAEVDARRAAERAAATARRVVSTAPWLREGWER